MDDLTAQCSYYAPMDNSSITVYGLSVHYLFTLTYVLQALPRMTCVRVNEDNLEVVANGDLHSALRDVQAAIKLSYRDDDVMISYTAGDSTTMVLRPDGTAFPEAAIRNTLERRDYDKWLERHGFVNIGVVTTLTGTTSRLYEITGFNNIDRTPVELNQTINALFDTNRSNWRNQFDGRVTMFTEASWGEIDWIGYTHAAIRNIAGPDRQVALRMETAYMDHTDIRIYMPNGSRRYYSDSTPVGTITNDLAAFLPANARR